MTEKEIVIKKLRELLIQVVYGNVYQHQIESFVDSILELNKSQQTEKEKE